MKKTPRKRLGAVVGTVYVATNTMNLSPLPGTQKRPHAVYTNASPDVTREGVPSVMSYLAFQNRAYRVSDDFFRHRLLLWHRSRENDAGMPRPLMQHVHRCAVVEDLGQVIHLDKAKRMGGVTKICRSGFLFARDFFWLSSVLARRGSCEAVVVAVCVGEREGKLVPILASIAVAVQ